MKKHFYKIIEEICNEEQINYKFLSKDWVIMLEKNGKTRFISGYKFDSNAHALGLILDDKYALYEVLNAKNIPIVEHNIVYNKTNKCEYAIGCNTKEYVENIFHKYDNHIVLKPNDGTCGHNVYNVTNIKELDLILEKMFKNNFSISICPFYKIKNEYRVIILNNEPKLIYKKIRPIVQGTGNKSIKELLLEFNPSYFINKLESEIYDRILKKDEIYEYNWKFNLSQGAKAEKVDDNELTEKLSNLAKKISEELNINFASIDIIETENNEMLVLEINSGVMIENYLNIYPEEYNNIKQIYKSAIESLF